MQSESFSTSPLMLAAVRQGNGNLVRRTTWQCFTQIMRSQIQLNSHLQKNKHMLQGVDPVLRTYNTLIIACNMCGQPREAMAVYRRMLDAGYNPNATTYNALISAYGKSGQLDKVRADSLALLFACRP